MTPRRDIPSWDRYFISIAKTISTRSKDPRSQVGCVLVHPEHREIRSGGYNGFVRGDADSDPALWERPGKHDRIVHAEANAVASAALVGESTAGCLLYTTCLPCLTCARLIAQAGVIEVFVSADYRTAYLSDWLTEETITKIRDFFDRMRIPLYEV